MKTVQELIFEDCANIKASGEGSGKMQPPFGVTRHVSTPYQTPEPWFFLTFTELQQSSTPNGHPQKPSIWQCCPRTNFESVDPLFRDRILSTIYVRSRVLVKWLVKKTKSFFVLGFHSIWGWGWLGGWSIISRLIHAFLLILCIFCEWHSSSSWWSDPDFLSVKLRPASRKLSSIGVERSVNGLVGTD